MSDTPLSKHKYIVQAASLAITVLLFSFNSCQQKANTANTGMAALDSLDKLETGRKRIDSIAALIQPGDLVLRAGNDFTSESLRQLNQRNQSYSHCGIANVENGQVYVYHALGGEFNPDQKIRRDSLQHFADPASNRRMVVYRYVAPDMRSSELVAKAQQMYQAGIMFDMAFDLRTNDRMYCAEYVYKALLLASKGAVKCNLSHIGQFEFVGVDDLFLHPFCIKQAEIVYK
jgi:Permuted papain-like amidase enzyme, YaeF/YiiX, C92 family